MKRIRTKLILSLLLITLLPVFPIYYLVKNLLQQSIEVGYNQNVELALEAAQDISRELYAKYKDETLFLARELASSRAVMEATKGTASFDRQLRARLNHLDHARLDIFDMAGQSLASMATDSNVAFKPLYQNVITPLADSDTPEILKSSSAAEILAFAPVVSENGRLGSLVVTRKIAGDFLQQRGLVVKVLQMFKTLDFFEGELTRGFLLSFFVVYAPIAAISIVLGIYFSRRITSPLVELAGATKKVAAGDWDYRVEVKTRDEIGELGAAFNRMISTLKEKQDQVIALEKMAVWREIARVLAHEIKNPLTPIQLMVQQMKDKYAGEDAEYRDVLAECASIINDEIESLRTLVREFSDFARMPRLNVETGNLNELITDVRKIYPADNIELHLQKSLPDSEFDPEKMRRVLINLIDNSMDSIKEKGAGKITLETFIESNTIHLSCSDTGAGIPDDVQKKIFEPYFSTKKSGMGLGMAIVRRIIIEHGGDILLHSEVGRGAQFHIKLPLTVEVEETEQSN